MRKMERKNDDIALEIDTGDLPKKKDLNQGNIKIKSALSEDGEATVLNKCNTGNDGNVGKKDRKKRERESTEDNHTSAKNAEIEENGKSPVDEPDCVMESSKRKKRKLEVHENEHGNKNVSLSTEITVGENVVSYEVVHSKTSSNEDESNIKSIVKRPDGEDSNLKKKKNTKVVDEISKEPKAKGKSKKPKTQEDNLIRGKRFTPEEDEIIKEAVMNYIKSIGLGEDGLKMVLNSGSYPGMENCWKEIGVCIPNRPYESIYYRAHILFQRSEKHAWTEEETEFLRKSYEKHGNNWKMIAEELGRHRLHVKDKWRLMKPSNLKSGKWSQEEYQSLYDLVNTDLQMKVVSKEKKSKHGMLRDNIRWGAISDKLSTRSDAICCKKWYSQLTSSLVAEDKWSTADDYRLISALYDLDAACVEDVDWHRLLEHRPGDVCRKRWDQMVLHIGHHGSKPFSEQVEVLSKRYCPDLAETREAWDNIAAVQ